MAATVFSFALSFSFFCAPSPAAVPADSTAARRDSLADSVRIVRTLSPLLVRATRLDVWSSEMRRTVGREALRSLPLDRVADALALQPGVVVDGDLVSIRGARPGELRVEMDGISLNEPFQNRGLDLPLVALEDLELIRGGRDAEHGGGLAGTLIARPAYARDRWGSRVLYETSGGHTTRDDRVGARVSGPIFGTGLGIAVGGEAHLDDESLPDLRTRQSTKVLGIPFGWRARNQVAALARLAPVKDPGRVAVQAIVSRRLLRPWNPMFSLKGWTTPCPDESCLRGPAFSPTAIDSARYAPYDAADHYPVTDVQRLAWIASSTMQRNRDRLRMALGWNVERRLTSVDGRADALPTGKPLWGLEGNPTSDPFHAYGGDAPLFRKTEARWFEGRADVRHEWRSGSALAAGASVTHEHVDFTQYDLAFVPLPWDSSRIFHASAPGAAGWLSARWITEGMIANLGVRLEWFSPGPDAGATLHDAEPHGILRVSPRFGFNFPITPRVAFQTVFERLQQAPGREFLYDSRTARILPRHPLGNPLIEPATESSYEVVLRHRRDELWSGSGGFFYRDFTGEVGARHVTLHPAGSGPSGVDALRYESADVGHALGFELTAERDDPGKNHLAVTYTWMQTKGSESFEDGVPFYPFFLGQPPPIAEHALAWDQQHRLTFSAFGMHRGIRAAWTTVVASGLPWTPAETRTPSADLTLVHSKRLGLYTVSDFSLKVPLPRRLAAASLGLDVRNVFDTREQRRVSIDGWPNPVINTQFDDYAAHREETGAGGAAFWDGGWVGVNDPRLNTPPRLVRVAIEMEW